MQKKGNFLSEPFLPPQPEIVVQTETTRNNSQTTSRETEIQDSELSLLESSFSDFAQSIAELNTSYDEVESENLSLSLDIEELKSKNKKLKRQLHEKNQLLSSYGVRNFNKRERRKTNKITKLEDTVSELTEKIKIVETREIAVEKKYIREKSKATYYKNKCEKINEKLNKTSSDLKFYENLSCEQKEKIDFGKINTIETFKGGKYSDEIRQVYYEMLCGNVSVGDCGDLLKKI